MSDKSDLLADVECRNMRGDANENLVISSGEVVSNLEISSQPHAWCIWVLHLQADSPDSKDEKHHLQYKEIKRKPVADATTIESRAQGAQ